VYCLPAPSDDRSSLGEFNGNNIRQEMVIHRDKLRIIEAQACLQFLGLEQEDRLPATFITALTPAAGDDLVTGHLRLRHTELRKVVRK
jgi:hypothetical protein